MSQRVQKIELFTHYGHPTIQFQLDSAAKLIQEQEQIEDHAAFHLTYSTLLEQGMF